MLLQPGQIHRSKYQNALREMARAGVAPRDADPWAQRLLRSIGVPHRPAFYRDFWHTVVVNGVSFAAIFLPILVLFYNRDNLFSVQIIVITGVLAGVFFGIGAALIARRKAIEFKLSSWDAL